MSSYATMAVTLLDVVSFFLSFSFLTTLFVAITVPLCYRLFQRLPPEPSKPKRCLAVRIAGIPPDTSREDVEYHIRSIVVEAHITTDVSVYYLVPTNRGTACTTATISTSSSKNEVLQRLSKAAPSYEFDCHFNGITSLYTPQAGADAE